MCTLDGSCIYLNKAVTNLKTEIKILSKILEQFNEGREEKVHLHGYKF